MRRITVAGAGMALVMVFTAAGCGQPKGGDMADMMKPPPRPPELDRLDVLVGRWEGTGEMTMAGADKPMISKGVNSCAWEADKRVLLEHFEGTMGDQGKMSGIGVWTYDPREKVYRSYWFDSFGTSSSGTATYDDKTRTFHMKGKGQDPMTGKATVGEGSFRMVDNNTMEYTYSEWDGWKTTKLFDMKGTSKRK